MYELIIKNYINKLTIDDILNYAKKENIKVSLNEASIIYKYIKEYHDVFLNGNPDTLFIELKSKLSYEVYDKCVNLYNKYKNYL